jgi:hypothetical protein
MKSVCGAGFRGMALQQGFSLWDGAWGYYVIALGGSLGSNT